MDLNETAVFVKVVQVGSFSGAAKLLDLPVSTVSVRISRLEKRLGVTLLQRTTRKLKLTEVGQTYYTHAAEGLMKLLDAEQALVEKTGEPSGLLRISAPADIGDHILTGIISKMRSRYPKVTLDILLIDRRVDLIAEGFDGAIRTGQLKDSTLIAKKIGLAKWAVFASPDYLAKHAAPLSVQDLKTHPCISFTPFGKTAWTLNSKDESVTIPMQSSIMLNDIGVIAALSASGQGVALLPLFLCQKDCDENKLVRLLPKWSARLDPINIVYPRQRFVSAKLRAFIDVAKEEFGKWLQD